jgi:hypothetical protein
MADDSALAYPTDRPTERADRKRSADRGQKTEIRDSEEQDYE